MEKDGMEILLITVRREWGCGAGGSEFADSVGARLGWPVLDRDIDAVWPQR